jgi:hypothetical protein
VFNVLSLFLLGEVRLYQNSKGIYNPKNFWIGCWLLKRFLNSTGCPMNDESLWWYTHSGEELLHGGNN